jgi:hypothetical protein
VLFCDCDDGTRSANMPHIFVTLTHGAVATSPIADDLL